MSTVTFPIRVYYEDTDSGGVVYYANYLKFAERARTEALRTAGIDQTNLLREHDIAFVVRRCEVDFLKPARLDDLLTIHTRLLTLTKVTLTMEQSIMRGSETLVELQVKLAIVGREMSLAKCPEFVHNALRDAFNYKDLK